MKKLLSKLMMVYAFIMGCASVPISNQIEKNLSVEEFGLAVQQTTLVMPALIQGIAITDRPRAKEAFNERISKKSKKKSNRFALAEKEVDWFASEEHKALRKSLLGDQEAEVKDVLSYMKESAAKTGHTYLLMPVLGPFNYGQVRGSVVESMQFTYFLYSKNSDKITWLHRGNAFEGADFLPLFPTNWNIYKLSRRAADDLLYQFDQTAEYQKRKVREEKKGLWKLSDKHTRVF